MYIGGKEEKCQSRCTKRLQTIPDKSGLECSESKFYQLLRKYREGPEYFTIAYARNRPQHRLPEEVDRIIRDELEGDRKLIGDKEIPIWNYNYATVRDNVVKRTNRKISAQTVRNRAKEWRYWMPQKQKEKAPPRKVTKNYWRGEQLFQAISIISTVYIN